MEAWSLALTALLGVTAGLVGGALGGLLSRRLGLMGVDVFKPWRRERVPESGGFGLALLLAALLPILHLVGGGEQRYYLAASLLTLYNAVVGLVDDLRRMDPLTKPLLTMTSASIIMLTCTLNPLVYIPLYGWAKLSIVYPAILPFLIGVSANAFNMFDVVNGSMPTAYLTVGVAMLVGYIVMSQRLGYHSPEPLTMLVYTLAAVAAYLLAYNRYPARVFNGDSGSLALGALAAYLAMLSKQELIYLIAMTPLILNGFQIITTMRGFAERREIPRPTVIDERGLVHARCDPRSPPTIVQLLTLREPLDEKSVYLALLATLLVSLAVAVIAALLVYAPSVQH